MAQDFSFSSMADVPVANGPDAPASANVDDADVADATSKGPKGKGRGKSQISFHGIAAAGKGGKKGGGGKKGQPSGKGPKPTQLKEKKDPKKRNTVLLGKFSSGITLVEPVGYAILYTSLVANYAGMYFALYKCRNQCAKPETSYTIPFLVTLIDACFYSVRRAAYLFDNSVIPWRGATTQPDFKSSVQAQMKTGFDSMFCTNINGPLLLHSIGQVKSTDGVEINSVGYYFAEPPADTTADDLAVDNYVGRALLDDVFSADVLATDVRPSMLLALAVCYSDGMSWADAMVFLSGLFFGEQRPQWMDQLSGLRFGYETDLNAVQQASLGRVFQGYGFAELNRDLRTVMGFNAGLLGVETLRNLIKTETQAEISRHGIRFVPYAKTVVNFDPAHLIVSDFESENIAAINVYREQYVRSNDTCDADVVDLAVLATVNITTPDNEIMTRTEQSDRSLYSCRVWTQATALVPDSVMAKRKDFIGENGLEIAKRANPTAYTTES